MNGRVRNCGLLILVAIVAVACAPVALSPQATQTPTATAIPTTTPNATPTHYDQSELFALPLHPTDIAVSDSQLFVAEIDLGARFSQVRSMIVVMPLAGGAPATLPGSETPQGTGILGLTYYGGALYVSKGSTDFHANGVFRLVPGQQPVAVAGGPGGRGDLNSGNGDGGPATAAAIQGPQGLAFSSAGDLFVAETGDSRIRVIRGTTISTYAGNGCSGASATPSGNAKTVTLCSPAMIALDKSGSLYVAPRNGAKWIAKIDPTGAVTTISNAFAVAGLAIDQQGNLLAADAAADGRILRFASSAAAPTVLASNLGMIRGGLAVGTDGSIYFASSRSPAGLATSWKVMRLKPST